MGRDAPVKLAHQPGAARQGGERLAKKYSSEQQGIVHGGV
jgi:hypothetical protein